MRSVAKYATLLMMLSMQLSYATEPEKKAESIPPKTTPSPEKINKPLRDFDLGVREQQQKTDITRQASPPKDKSNDNYCEKVYQCWREGRKDCPNAAC